MASILKVDKLDPQSGTDLELGTSGDTITIPSGATLTVSGTMNASSITAGTVATARLGSGTASSTTVLYGDQTYKTEPTGGKILQVINATTATIVASTTATMADTGLTATITPSATTSKILVTVAQTGTDKVNNSFGRCFLQRDGSDILEFDDGWGYTATTDDNRSGNIGCTYLDSPATTSAVVYKTQFASQGSVATVSLQINSSVSTITLMEVGA